MKKFKYGVVLVLITFTLLLSGCPKNKAKMPKVMSDKIINYVVTDFNNHLTAYNNAINRKDFEAALLERDKIIFKLKGNIDANYNSFEEDLFKGRATTNILGDVTELAASAAIGITNGERAKNIIAIALTAFKGGRKSIDVNLFREKTTEILISNMRAARSRQIVKINKGLEADVKGYSLEEGLGDLINYFYAGSLSNALVELSELAAKEAEKEKVKADEAEYNRIRIRNELLQSGNIRTIMIKLESDVNSSIKSKNTAKQDEIKKKVISALKEIYKIKGITVKPIVETNDVKTLFNQLGEAISSSTINQDYIPTNEILLALQKTIKD